MVVLNFGHPLTAGQLAAVRDLAEGDTLGEVLDIRVQLVPEKPFGPQIAAVIDALRRSPQWWQSTPLLVVPPGLSPAACVLLAELHGRMGYFPTVLRLRAEATVAGSPPIFVPCEVLRLSSIREEARERR